MKRILNSTMLGLVMLTPFPANADWQYTKWGMTVDEVLTASKGKLRRCSVEACKGQTTDKTAAQITGEYKAGEFAFAVYALFDKRSNRLSSINLELLNPTQGHSLVGSVRAKYGEPATVSRTPVMTLHVWGDQIDQISIMAIGPNTTLQYQPRLTESNKGL